MELKETWRGICMNACWKLTLCVLIWRIAMATRRQPNGKHLVHAPEISYVTWNNHHFNQYSLCQEDCFHGWNNNRRWDKWTGAENRPKRWKGRNQFPTKITMSQLHTKLSAVIFNTLIWMSSFLTHFLGHVLKVSVSELNKKARGCHSLGILQSKYKNIL